MYRLPERSSMFITSHLPYSSPNLPYLGDTVPDTSPTSILLPFASMRPWQTNLVRSRCGGAIDRYLSWLEGTPTYCV